MKRYFSAVKKKIILQKICKGKGKCKGKKTEQD